MIRVAAKRVPLVVAAVIGLSLAAGAVAFFSGGGAGSGTAAVGRALAVRVDAGAIPGDALSPGSDGDVTVHIANTSAAVLHVGSLVLDTASGAGGFDATPTACDPAAAALSFAAQTNGGNGWTVPAKTGDTDGRLDLDLPGSIRMGADASNGCQGALFTVHLTAEP